METIIKVNPSELNIHLLEKIKSLIGSNKNVDVTISLNEYDLQYADELSNSINQANAGEIKNFTMKEFMDYSPAISND